MSITIKKAGTLLLLAVGLWSLTALPARGQLRRYATNFGYSLKNFVDTIPIDFDGGQIYVTVEMNGQPYNGADSVVVNNRGYNIAYVPVNSRAGVGLVMPWSNEYKAGLRQGDTIIAVNGEAVASFEQFIGYPFVYGRQYRLLVEGQRGQHKEVTFTR